MVHREDIWCGCPPWEQNNIQMKIAITHWGLGNVYKYLDEQWFNGNFVGGGFVKNDEFGSPPLNLQEFYWLHKKDIWEDYKKKHPNAKFYGDTEFDDLDELEYTLFNDCNNLLSKFEKLPDLDLSNKDNFKHYIEELKKLILMRVVIRNYESR